MSLSVSSTSSLHQSRAEYDWLVNRLDRLADQEPARSDCSELNDLAVEWIDLIDAELGHYMAALWTAEFQYQTNLTEYNERQFEDVRAELNAWFLDNLPTARTLHESSRNICNSTAKRLISIFVNQNLPPLADDQETNRQISHLTNEMVDIYSTAVVTDNRGQENRLDPELTNIISTSRDYDELKWAWQGWRNATGLRIKPLYSQLVDNMNRAAVDNGYSDVSKSWQVTDFEQPDIEPMVLRLYEQIEPFYQQLHAYVRRRLTEVYRNHGMDPRGPIPAHILGNMWAQDWVNIYDLVTPYPEVESIDVTSSLLRANYSALRMFREAESFFTSVGLEPMTSDFWNKSMFVRPNDGRQVACHGSASDFYTQTDFRIKMCTQVNADDFQTVHHEMGHIEYFMQYRHLANLFRMGANAAFHEAVGDTVALSVATMQHLYDVHLSDVDPDTMSPEQHINFLMKMALTKVSFLPFALILDKWRFEVFRGDVSPTQYNRRWWQLRERYQGVKAPVARSDDDFDPGSKYHVPANVPYFRYFLSYIGQFQFQKALCQAKGHRGSLHTCDIYRSTAAGDKLMSVLRLGLSRPWREAMRLMTGQREFDARPVLDYFEPLINWLRTKNTGHHVGWQ